MAIESDPDGWTNEVDPQKRDIRPCFIKEMIHLPTINLLGENPLVFMGVITSLLTYEYMQDSGKIAWEISHHVIMNFQDDQR